MSDADDKEPPGGNGSPNPAADDKSKTEVNANEIKVLLNSHAPATNNFYLGSDGANHAKALEELPDALPSLPPHLHPFVDPRHDFFVSELEQKRILLLTSYEGTAAYSAAYSLVTGRHFQRQTKRALFPTRRRDRERSDLDLSAFADDELLGNTPQIVLVEIESWCPLLDSVLLFGHGTLGKIRDRLEAHLSYLVLAIDEDQLSRELATARPKRSYPFHTVSHLLYVLARHFGERAADVEKRLLAAVRGNRMEMPELYRRVADRLAVGVPALEEFLRELEEASALPISTQKERLQPVSPESVFRDDSEVHCAAVFVATYFPGLGQGDFDRLVRLLLSDDTRIVESPREVVHGEERTERWSMLWVRRGDQIFRECHVDRVVAPDGSWLLDFNEPYLRRELRAFMERRAFWYLKWKCQILKDSGLLFAFDLSTPAVEGLIRLFVERAVVDPAGFGSGWLVDLIGGLSMHLNGHPPSDSPQARLVWLLQQLAAEAQLRAHFHGRLALLIREMLDRETLRPMVRDFFDFLIAAGQHDALLGVVLDLARRLRFAPHFDPLIWLRRLFDQGNDSVRTRTVSRLITLARESGPRIYEYLDGIRAWLPEQGRSPERFSPSNQLALGFPFIYCSGIAASLPPERFGEWPSRHPLFYALPTEREEARREMATFVEWMLDSRGEALTVESTDAHAAEQQRAEKVANVIEHWFLVLTGRSGEGAQEGRALFDEIAAELHGRLDERQRYWMQQRWKQRQIDSLAQATTLQANDATALLLMRHRARLDDLRVHFATLSRNPSMGGTLP